MPLLLALVLAAAPPASSAQEVDTAREFHIQGDASWLRVLAGPAGPLRRFGHHHVISHNAIAGSVTVASNPLESMIELEIAVAELEVDDPDLRRLEGEDFEKEVSQKDIDGTRANMLGEKLLNAEQFPTIRVSSTEIRGSLPDVDIVAMVEVLGQEHTVTFPATIELADDAFVARGELEITHGELGLSPFKAAGGALSVRDVLVMKYEIAGSQKADSE